MSVTIADVATTLQTVLTVDAHEAARTAGFIRRQRKLTGASFVQALVFGSLAHPQTTLGDFATATAAVGTPVTAPGIHQRFTPAAAECLRLVLHKAVAQALAADPQAIPLLQRFPGVYLLDSTTVSLPAVLAALWPGCGGRTPSSGAAALKIQVRWEIRHGQVDGLDLQPGRGGDADAPLNTAPLPAGALRLADLGYFRLDHLQAYSRQDVYWLTRLKWSAAVYHDGRRLRDLVGWLQQHAATECDVAVAVGSSHRLRCRLVAVRVPEGVARVRRQRLRRKARDTGEKVRPERLAACAWDLWITNLPRSLASLAEVKVLGRVRWQIELLFKRWKSQGKLAERRSANPYRVLSEVYARLLGQVVQQWVLLLGWERLAGRSLWRATAVVQAYALTLATLLPKRRLLTWLLEQVQRVLGHCERLQKRKTKPATFQRCSGSSATNAQPAAQQQRKPAA